MKILFFLLLVAVAASDKVASGKEVCSEFCPEILQIGLCGDNGEEKRPFPNRCVLEKTNCENRNANKPEYRVIGGQFCNDAEADRPARWSKSNLENLTQEISNRNSTSGFREVCRSYCTYEYTPLCGDNGEEKREFGNFCAFEIANCENRNANKPEYKVTIGRCNATGLSWW